MIVGCSASIVSRASSVVRGLSSTIDSKDIIFDPNISISGII